MISFNKPAGCLFKICLSRFLKRGIVIISFSSKKVASSFSWIDLKLKMEETRKKKD
jgi:hypothetical protein